MSAEYPSRAALITEAPIKTVLWRLGAPNVVAVATMTAVTFADAVYAGRLGVAPLASLALAFPFLTLMQMMAGGAIGGGVTSAIARAFGAGDAEKAERLAWHAVLIAATMSCIFMVVLGLFPRPIFMRLGGEGAALDGAVAYARIAFGGGAATWFLFVIAAVHRGAGDTVTPARAITVAAVIQVVLSGALTLGWFGAPRLGLVGTAAAMVVCQGSAALYLTVCLLRGRGGLRLRRQPFVWAHLRDIMSVGGLGLFNSLCMAMTVVVVTGYIGRFGIEALAGYGVGARLELMLVPIAFGMGAALTAAVGVNVGANQHARARRIAMVGAGVVMVGTGAIGLTAAFAPNLWLGLFTDDPAATAIGARYLGIAAPFYGIFGAGQALYFASQGTGRMRLPVLVTFSRFLTVALLGGAVIAAGMDIWNVFAAAAIGLTMMGVGQGLCLLGPGWRPRIVRR
ncbi:MATE family efflux transporter [Minwuia sp. IMCC3060]|uniref:MATE family efflux transporter n=1 Tax=Minwuia sp. IMCC3060 TaxID=3040675 RepID=UPI0024793B4A|nr:MATE family efflux transporter [Minwuia sp. IMCC3060]